MNNFETFGAHIRNILGPYANIVTILEDIHKTNDELLKDFLLTKINPEKLRKNLNHFIEFSHLQELENLNWRDTELCEKYYNEQ